MLYNAGLMYQKSQQLERAAGLYREALAQQPEMTEALVNLGSVLIALGQEEEAKALDEGNRDQAGAGAQLFRAGDGLRRGA